MSVPYWRLSSFYFCYFATLGAFLPFWSLYLKHIGFNAEQIGELMAMLVATKVVAPYLWGWLADKTGCCLRLIRITALLSTLAFAGFLYRQDFQWVSAVTIGFSFFWNACLPQFEAATLIHLKQQPQRYSSIRLWGSVGFVAAVLGIGRFLDDFSIDCLPMIITTLLGLNWMVALITPEASQANESKANGSLAGALFKPEPLAFFAVYMLLQVSHSPYYTFYSVYLQQYDYSATETGLLWALGVCSEIVIFLGMYRLLKYVGLRGLLLASLLLTTLRWLIIAYGAESYALIVGAQLLHAASFGVAHVVAMQLLQVYFGNGHQSSGLALYSSLSFGLGGMIGGYYSGQFWDLLGGGTVFAIAAWICGLALLIAFIGVARRDAKPA
jgi:PPP family 3-phenylpropionic acid transporter